MGSDHSIGHVLFGRTRQAVLSLMFLRPDESFFLREIARRTGKGLGAVQRELVLLTQSGILRKDRSRFYQANKQSPIFVHLQQIVLRTIGLGDRLQTAFASFAHQVHVAFIFGSFARGEQELNSDIDVMVIRRGTHPSIDDLTQSLKPTQEQVGREISLFLMEPQEWQAKAAVGNGFVRRVLSDNKVFLIGGIDELNALATKQMDQPASANQAGNRRPHVGRRSRSQKREGKGT